ncbi:MAG: hypothetical protein J6Y32_00555 [Bacteroidales bacterium]|nr:hypothetical protein [Bacteroidales bacterium]
MKNFSVISLCLLCALLWSPVAKAGTLRGHIDKRDTVVSPAAYAMAYVAELRTGATADENGDFTLALPESCNGRTLRVEYSLIGYATTEKDIVIPASGQQVTDEVLLDFAPIMLAASYVTADGKDPAEYILSQVWKTADKNKKKVKNYTADVVYTIGTHELPVVTSVLPGFTLMMGKIAAGFMGLGPLVDYCTKHDDLKATVSLHRVVKNGVRKDSNQEILEITQDVPKNVQNNIKNVFGKIDLYGMLYGSNNAWGRKFTRRSTFVLEGSYNYGDYIIDVLHWKDPNTDAEATIHVIEDLWQILKVQVGRQEEAVLCEARDYGGGIFMPVSFVIKPALTRVKVKDIPKAIERVKVEIRDKTIRKRAIKLLEGYQERGEDFDPYVLARYNVRYGVE